MPIKDKEAKRLYDQNRYLLTMQFAQEYKVKQGCADCGYNKHHAGLEFDHRDGKRFNVASMYSRKIETLMEEISKCDVVCGTCHNIRTYNRKHGVRSLTDGH